MKLLILFSIIILNLSIFINSQELYANFIPYSNEGCKDELSVGVGFSFVATNGNCYNDIGKSFNNVFNSEEYSSNSGSSSSTNEVTSWLVIIDALRVGVAEFRSENGSCSGDYINANSIKNGTCLNTPNFIPFIGKINNNLNLTQQYSLVTISKEPYYPINQDVQVYSVFNSESSDCNLLDLYYSVYFSNNLNLTLKNNSEYIITQCNNGGIASNLLCLSNSNCNKVIIPDACNNIDNDYGFDQVYCTLSSASQL